MEHETLLVKLLVEKRNGSMRAVLRLLHWMHSDSALLSHIEHAARRMRKRTGLETGSGANSSADGASASGFREISHATIAQAQSQRSRFAERVVCCATD
mmetsp:Transcript_9873/g.26264  ORF Transcript_9873/g.26264 Transcript_9873/m.26264 type:complete len:99 (+) Transcript_9873:379-675(+)